MKKRFLIVLAIFLLVLITFSFAQEECLSDEDCAPGELCDEGECLMDEEMVDDSSPDEGEGPSSGTSVPNRLPAQASSPAPTPTTSANNIPCEANTDCPSGKVCLEDFCQTAGQFAQSVQTTPPDQTSASTPTTTPPFTQQVNTLQQEVTSLEQKLTQLTQQLTSLNTQSQTSNQKIQTLQTDIQTIKTQLNSLKTSLNQVNSLSTGLASAQTSLQNTQKEVTDLEKQVSEIEESGSFTKKLFFVFVMFLAFAGAAVYILYFKKPKVHPELKKHIYQHIQKGRPYAPVRKELLDAGWQEEHVDQAYKAVLTHNYSRYLQSKSPSKTVQGINKNKTALIAIISVIVVIGAILILRATVGKAIQTQTAFAHDEPFVCTPPHIVTEGGCCLDTNANNICDIDEAYEEERVEIEEGEEAPVDCEEHRDCLAGQLCIDKSCGVLNKAHFSNNNFLMRTYNEDCPEADVSCNLRDISITTSDGEIYVLSGRKGSYTAGGALAWTLRPLPNYCEDETIRVPIEIQKTGLVCSDSQGQEIPCDQNTNIACTTDQDCDRCSASFSVACKCHLPSGEEEGTCFKDVIKKIKTEVLSKELITLEVGQESEEFTHPNEAINRRLGGFTLTLNSAVEFCRKGANVISELVLPNQRIALED